MILKLVSALSRMTGAAIVAALVVFPKVDDLFHDSAVQTYGWLLLNAVALPGLLSLGFSVGWPRWWIREGTALTASAVVFYQAASALVERNRGEYTVGDLLPVIAAEAVVFAALGLIGMLAVRGSLMGGVSLAGRLFMRDGSSLPPQGG